MGFLSRFIIGFLFCSCLHASPVPIVQMAGNWQVKHVGIDNWISSHIYMSYDDPRLVGRRVAITSDAITPKMSEMSICQKPVLNAGQSMPLDQLVQLTSGQRHSEPFLPLAKDFLISLPGNKTVTPLMLTCQSGSFSWDGEKIKAWVMMPDSDTLIIPYNMNTYLTLKRISPNLKPLPSFNCRQAMKPEEEAICDSFDLAAWDESVNDAYHAAISQTKEMNPGDRQAIKEIVKQQKSWLNQREKCGDDGRCLYKSMAAQVEVLAEYFR